MLSQVPHLVLPAYHFHSNSLFCISSTLPLQKNEAWTIKSCIGSLVQEWKWIARYEYNLFGFSLHLLRIPSISLQVRYKLKSVLWKNSPKKCYHGPQYQQSLTYLKDNSGWLWTPKTCKAPGRKRHIICAVDYRPKGTNLLSYKPWNKHFPFLILIRLLSGHPYMFAARVCYGHQPSSVFMKADFFPPVSTLCSYHRPYPDKH